MTSTSNVPNFEQGSANTEPVCDSMRPAWVEIMIGYVVKRDVRRDVKRTVKEAVKEAVKETIVERSVIERFIKEAAIEATIEAINEVAIEHQQTKPGCR